MHLPGLIVRRGRIIPLLLGLGILSWSIGDLALAIESAGGATPPVPSASDAFYLAFYPISYAGLLLLMRGQVRSLSAASWLDGAVAGVGAAAVCAAFVFEGVLRSAGGGTAAVATNLAYPVGDLLLLAMVVGGTAVLPNRRNPRWLLLAAGYAINAVGDTFNLFQSGIGRAISASRSTRSPGRRRFCLFRRRCGSPRPPAISGSGHDRLASCWSAQRRSARC